MTFPKLRLFRKKGPEMITDSNYDQILRQQEPPSPQSSFLSNMVAGPYQVFGKPLDEVLQLDAQFDSSSIYSSSSSYDQLCAPEYQKYVPEFLFKCLRYITDYGLKEEGLYRISGSFHAVRELRDAFVVNGPGHDIPLTTDVHAVTSLVKNFLRELPHPVLPVTQCHTFLAYAPGSMPTELDFANGSASNYSVFTAAEEDLNPHVIPTQILQEILQSQAPANFALVQTLMRHFAAVLAQQKHNRMSLSSLSVILCPSLKIHKSVFHALVLKHDRVWFDLHPHAVIKHESPRSTRTASSSASSSSGSSYRHDDETGSFVTATASSTASLTDMTTVSSMGGGSDATAATSFMDPVSYDLFTSTPVFYKAEHHHRRSTMIMPLPTSGAATTTAAKHEGDFFDCNSISFTNPREFQKPEPLVLLSSPTESRFRTGSGPATPRTLFQRKSVADF